MENINEMLQDCLKQSVEAAGFSTVSVGSGILLLNTKLNNVLNMLVEKGLLNEEDVTIINSVEKEKDDE